MPKKIASKLDQFAEALLAMERDLPAKTLKEMQAWLVEEGVNVDQSTISRFLESLRQSRLQDRLLAQIAAGAQQVKEVESQFGKNPAPELETLIKLHRVLIMQMSTKGNADPEFLKLSDQMLRTTMEYVSGKTKAEQKERELNLAEEKFAALKKKAEAAQAELQKLRDPKSPMTDAERLAIVDKVDEILGIKK